MRPEHGAHKHEPEVQEVKEGWPGAQSWPTPREVTIEVPRDGAGTFAPSVIVKKRQRRLNDVDAVPISLNAKGLTAAAIQQVLRSEQLGQPAGVTTAYAATVRSLVAIVTTLNTEIANLEKEVKDHFGRHPDAEIVLSQPGLGQILGARVLAEFGDVRHCEGT